MIRWERVEGDESDGGCAAPHRALCTQADGHRRSDGFESSLFRHRQIEGARCVHGEWTRKNRVGESSVVAMGIRIG